MKKTKLPSVPPEVNTNWEQMLKRFCTSLSECRIIDTHISECRMLITSCRAAEAASLPGDSTRAMLAIHLHQCGFRPAHPEDLDSISADLDAIQRGNNELTAEEEKAVQAVMRIPFAVTMLPTDTEELDHTIKAIISRAEKTNRIADKLAVEFTTAGMVCDIVDAIERFARAGKKNVAKTEEICRNVYRAARRGSAAFMQDWFNNPNLQETGRQRKTGGGAKAKWDTNNEQCKALWNLAQRKTFDTASAAADLIIRNECPKSNHPFAYTKRMSAKEKNKVRTKLIKRFKSWCRINGKPYPFGATE